MKHYLYRYRPRYIKTLLYMLQASGYHPKEYWAWVARTRDFSSVAKRQTLTYTAKLKLLALSLAVVTLIVAGAAVLLMIGGIASGQWGLAIVAFVLLVCLPYIQAFSVVVPLWLGERIVQGPRQRVIIRQATDKAAAHKGRAIAIAGSYGKTTFKETLRAILSQSFAVAATPGNKNTILGTSQFIASLKGDEDIVIYELGESHIGDVAELCAITHPDMGVITGINEAHLESFGSIDNTVGTIFELQDYLGDKPVYKNIENQLVAERAGKDDSLGYSRSGVNGWKIRELETSLGGTVFTAQKGSKMVRVDSELIGEHQAGPIVACIDIADRLGMGVDDIVAGIKNTKAFEHRMQPLKIGGATVIDDTYNGNIDGIRSGLDLLKKAEAKRKIYVTPGLVEQGERTREIHEEIGQRIAEACDVVVLMQNSVTAYLRDGLSRAHYKGELQIISDPLRFYTNLDQFVAHGDVVLMQNDWTDNYN